MKLIALLYKDVSFGGVRYCARGVEVVDRGESFYYTLRV